MATAAVVEPRHPFGQLELRCTAGGGGEGRPDYVRRRRAAVPGCLRGDGEEVVVVESLGHRRPRLGVGEVVTAGIGAEDMEGDRRRRPDVA